MAARAVAARTIYQFGVRVPVDLRGELGCHLLNVGRQIAKDPADIRGDINGVRLSNANAGGEARPI
jgi:alkyl sulfatase BDS1-like metallo-beta-lactamase superfamily hydrolase